MSKLDEYQKYLDETEAYNITADSYDGDTYMHPIEPLTFEEWSEEDE